MFLGNPIPTWKQIFTINVANNRKTFYEELFPNAYFMAESCMSIRLVLNAIKNVGGKDIVTVLLPDYFCNQTISSFQEKWVNLVFYPINEDFNPDWGYIKAWAKENDFDVFIFTHYFGKYCEIISRVKELCKNHEAILIEDCAHVLYPTKKIGTNGDFVIYSPHKQLPINDGGVLICNDKKSNLLVDKLNRWIKFKYDKLPENSTGIFWRIKKSIQRLYPVHRRIKYNTCVHDSIDKGTPRSMRKISKLSYSILCNYDYIEFKKIAQIRRDNLEMMNSIILTKYPGIVPLINDEVDIPYFAVYSLQNVRDKDGLTKSMIKDGFTVLYWPDLPYQLNGTEGHESMKRLSKNIILIPIHQDINHQNMVRKFVKYDNSESFSNENRIGGIEWLNEDDNSRMRYNNILASVLFSNIPQNWDYGNVKRDTENSSIIRGVIKARSADVGVIQILIKKKYGLPIAARINRGPLLIKQYDTIVNHIQVLNIVRSKISHPIPLVVAPSLEYNPKNIAYLTRNKWHQWNPYGYETGIIDLSLSTDEIRKKLDSKWRNQLKSAEKMHLTINMGFDLFDEIEKKYENNQKEKGYIGIPKDVLYKLKNLKDCPIVLFYLVNNDGAVISFDIFYFTSNFALYFVGWNDKEGRKMYANNLLLFHAVQFFKDKGIKWLDLGGIDYINTEENARFKDGMRPQHIRLVGEFIKF
ncbi:MAG: peptidoglycan bridge formation glycyltransferase FemA/FemB family protein [Clostridia bacterium]|nr:peptidoglycan bridge formation glycyltransferase FemA/FemB family protein [Clostridia bacterium]